VLAVGAVGCASVTDDDFLRTTRASYDAVAGGYAERFRDELAARPLDRAMLAGFAELVRTAGAGPETTPQAFLLAGKPGGLSGDRRRRS
jgi:hypothetical protein